MAPIMIDVNTLAGAAGVVLSLVFGYVPGVEAWYSALDSKVKASIMGILLIVVAGFLFGGGCLALFSTNIVCDKQGALTLLQIVIAALAANQSTYLLAVRPFKQ